jgi:serine/threonine protein kinase
MIGGSEEIEEFKREANLLFSLQHPNVIHALGCYNDGNDTYLVMEFCPNGR